MVQRVLGTAFIAAAIWLAADALAFRRGAIPVVGVLVGVERRLSVDDDGVSLLQRPIVEFRPAPRAEPVEVRARTWTLLGFGRVGDAVALIHRPGEPASARLDRWFDDALLPVVFAVLGIAGLRGQLQGGRHRVWFRRRWDE